MSIHRLISYMTAVFLAGFSVSESQQLDFLRTRLQTEDAIPGWAPIDTARIYRGTELFDFIDGGADLFLEYGFGQALGLEFTRNGPGSIILEIYQMDNPAAAFGIYSVRSGQEGRPVAVGGEGSIHPYYLMFWRGAYYVSVTASDSSEVCRKGMEEIARVVDRQIRDHEQRPTLVAFLPAEGILKVRYVRGPLGVMVARTLDMKELFPIVEGTIGTYTNHTLLLMRYPDTSVARIRLESTAGVLKARGEYTHHRTEGGVSSARNGERQTICFGREGSYLVISISEQDSLAWRACESLRESLQRKVDEEPGPR